jgi:hypothetical protein
MLENDFKEGVNLKDSSLFDNFDTIIDKDLYVSKLISLLRPLLQEVFPNNPIKQQIHYRKNGKRINFSCIYCGDSHKSDYNKRGNIILEGKHKNHFKCFNCGEFKRIDYFFKDFNKNLDFDLINYISKDLNDFSNYSNVNESSIFLDNELIEKHSIDREEFKKFFGLTEVKGSKVWPWLCSRLQFNESKFLYNPENDYLFILNLTRSGKILGVQKRFLDNRVKNRFNTLNLSKIYEYMKKEDKVPEEIDIYSMIFNICLIDIDIPITLFEGPMDCFLMNNGIANCGLSKHFPLDLPIRYFFDKDQPGVKKSIEEINKGNEVFLWQKLIDKYSIRYQNKIDLNSLIIYFKNNNIQFNNYELNNYFSSDPLDVIDI